MLSVIKNLVSKAKYSIKCPYSMKATRIVVHNTANDASARNEIAYMIRNDNQVSFHFAIDDKEIVQGIPLDRNAWHSGDGNGKGNREGIAVEICYSKSGGTRFTNAEKLASKFIAQLLKERGWGISKVTKHQDYNGKYCPHRTLDMGWQRFLNMVQKELNALNGTQTKPTISNNSDGKLEDYNGYVEVIYNGSDGLDYHKSPSWDSKSVAGTAKKGDVFTVVGRILVDGTYMYKLKSGNYITSASKYVSFRKTLHDSSSGSSSSVKTKSYAGKEVKLSKKPLYASADAKASSNFLTGTYYYWSNEIINGRIRITNSKSRVGVKGQVTGWINV